MARSEKYEVRTIRSGSTASYVYVNFGFSSPLEKWDAFHVVCAKKVDDQDREMGMGTIYLERFDQAYSCYQGAESIRAHARGVDLRLTKKGTKALDFPPLLHFVFPPRISGLRKALQNFKRMRRYRWGRVVNVV
jgi:hypothetical protein